MVNGGQNASVLLPAVVVSEEGPAAIRLEASYCNPQFLMHEKPEIFIEIIPGAERLLLPATWFQPDINLWKIAIRRREGDLAPSNESKGQFCCIQGEDQALTDRN
jgi:hypothetical protein